MQRVNIYCVVLDISLGQILTEGDPFFALSVLKDHNLWACAKTFWPWLYCFKGKEYQAQSSLFYSEKRRN